MIDTPTGSGPLLVNAALAGDLAERLVGWYLFPTEGKTPKYGCHWQSHAATGREAVESLWRRFGGYNEDGTEALTGVGVACDPSGIFVIDEDRDWRSDEESPTTDWQEWATALDSCNSLILPSSNRGRPHYYFRQPSDGEGRVAERVWHGGEIKSKGFVVLAAAPPIYQPSSAGGGLWTPADVAEAIPPLVELIGRRRTFGGEDSTSSDGGSTSFYGHRVTKEEFAAWLDQEPGEHFGGRLIAEEYEASFISKLTDKFRRSVDNGTSRRSACLNTIHTAIIESYQGLYSLTAAYDAIEDTYEQLRSHGPGDTSGDKGWTQRRADDYRGMWETEISKPDALRSAEASYDELLQRLSASGTNLEISDDDREEDAYCMSIIFSAGESPDEPAITPPQDSQPEPDATPDDDLSWDDAGVPDVESPKPEAPVAPTVAPVKLGAAAKRGVLWELASGLVGKHELPHEALMITLAGWAGCVLGSVGAGSMRVGEDRHGPELCVCMVGTSAVSHKSGTVSFGHMVFNEWIDSMETGVGAPGTCSGFFREVSGIESGQAFIEIWPSAADIAGGAGVGRAVMMVEKELTTMWKKAARKGSTIPEEIRKAWDGDMLAVRGVRAGNHRIQPQNYRFSAVGATIHSLAARTIVESSADISGDGNRWLWCWGQEVPDPIKGLPSFDDHILVEAVRNQVRGLIRSVEKARNQGWWPGSAIGPGGVPITEFGEPKLWWTPEADQAWLGDNGTPTAGKGIYADLRNELKVEAPGSAVVKGLKGRGAQQVMRLAIGYEMLKAGEGWAGLVRNTLRNDGTAWCISLEALEWANAVWRFCSDTVEHLFADSTGNEKVDELVTAIKEIARDQGQKFQNYVLKTDIVGNGFAKNAISTLIAQAEKEGSIWTGTLRREGRGAPPVVVGLPKWNPPPEVIKRHR
jgi:hypothetical protein